MRIICFDVNYCLGGNLVKVFLWYVGCWWVVFDVMVFRIIGIIYMFCLVNDIRYGVVLLMIISGIEKGLVDSFINEVLD